MAANDYHFVTTLAGRRDLRRSGRRDRRAARPAAMVAGGVPRRRGARAARRVGPRRPRAAQDEGVAALHAHLGVRRHRVAVSARARRSTRSAISSGAGEWTFEQDGPFVNVTFDWRVAAEKPLLRQVSAALRPVFEANHRWAMAQGEESLKLELARRRAVNVEARGRSRRRPGRSPTPASRCSAAPRSSAPARCGWRRGWRSGSEERPAPSQDEVNPQKFRIQNSEFGIAERRILQSGF